MEIPALESVDCAILHEAFKPMDGQRLLDIIQQAAARCGLTSECNLLAPSNHMNIYVMVEDTRIMVSQNPEPLGPAGFARVLAEPYTEMMFPDAQQVVASHQANTMVTVAKGVMNLNMFPEELQTDELKAVLSQSVFTEQGEVVRANDLVREISAAIIASNPASAVHWCVCDNLVSPQYFQMTCEARDNNLLNFRPIFTSSAGRLTSTTPVGATLSGTQWMFGKVIQFDEAIVPLGWLLPMLMGFVHFCEARGELLPHMDTFSVEGQDWTVAVYHEKIPDFDQWESVRLVLVDAPEFGIHGSVAEDAARRGFTKADAGMEPPHPQAANDVSKGGGDDVENWQALDSPPLFNAARDNADVQTKPTRRGVEVSELRDLVNNQNRDTTMRDQSPGGGLFGKLLRRKS